MLTSVLVLTFLLLQVNLFTRSCLFTAATSQTSDTTVTSEDEFIGQTGSSPPPIFSGQRRTPPPLAQSPRPNRNPSIPHAIGDLPQEILTRLLHPSNGLSRIDTSSFFSTSRDLRNVKFTVSRPFRFYYDVAVPHLSLNVNDGDIRVLQTFYKCARLSQDAKYSLAAFFYRRVASFSQAQFIVACVEQYTSMLATGIFPNITSIPTRFQIQLVYQTMHVEGAFEKLMRIFRFESPALRNTLHYERRCHGILHRLINESLASTLFSEWHAEHPMAAVGCLLSLDNQRVEHYINEHGGSGSYSSIFGDAIRESLLNLINVHHESVVAYEGMYLKFLKTPMDARTIADYVQRGFYINLALLVWQNEFSWMAAHHSFVVENQVLAQIGANSTRLQPFLDAGLHLHANHEVSPYGPIDLVDVQFRREWVTFLLLQGMDINHEGFEADEYLDHTILFDALMERHLTEGQVKYLLEDSDLRTLVDWGADVLQYDDNGHAPLCFLTKASDLPLIRYMVEHGRPDLNRQDARGWSFIYSLLSRRPDLEVVQYLVQQGLDIHSPSPRGFNAIQAARFYAVPNVAAWMAALPPRSRLIHRNIW